MPQNLRNKYYETLILTNIAQRLRVERLLRKSQLSKRFAWEFCLCSSWPLAARILNPPENGTSSGSKINLCRRSFSKKSNPKNSAAATCRHLNWFQKRPKVVCYDVVPLEKHHLYVLYAQCGKRYFCKKFSCPKNLDITWCCTKTRNFFLECLSTVPWRVFLCRRIVLATKTGAV